ncbi:hypothetical protein ACH46_18495 [Gordonia phthalatica]|uniref:Alcohol dehydrogenase n=2 Tax=Gordonia phthalatica TaxID=1136941 RepID=A0A0N9NIF9_9ACTN|nr:hypothetical protein ACH46_18495 [Gordonia phthalatica]
MLHARGLRRPAVLGHHTIGRVEQLTPEVEAAVGVAVGTRVVVEEYVACGHCEECRAGDYRFCATVDLWTGGERVGMIPADRGSGLHGGNAEYLEIGLHHVLHRLPEGLSVDLAAWTLPLANAVDWTLFAGGVGPGATVAVIGPGYHGLSCAAAALAGGASTVVVVGPDSESGAARLGFAEGMGASIETSDDGLVDRMLARYGEVDTVVDTVGSPQTMATATALLKRFGVLVIAGLSGGDVPLDPTLIVRKLLTVKGVRGRAPQAVRRAIELLGEGRTGLESVPTHPVALEDVEATLNAMNTGRGPHSPHIVVDPWRPCHDGGPTTHSSEGEDR